MSPRHTTAALLLMLAVTAAVPAQFSQSLPNNLLNVAGNNASAYPWATTQPNAWQWNYDTTNFVATSPIVITALYIRAGAGSTSPGGTDPSVEVKFASSLVDWSTTGIGTVFAAVMDVDVATVYNGPVVIPGGLNPSPAPWIPIGPITPFYYDPTQGKDFIIQVRAFGPNVAAMALVELHSNGSGQRYGSQTSATITVANFSNVNIVPVVRIDYQPASNLFAATTTGGGLGDLMMSLTSIPAGATEGYVLVSALTNGPVGTGGLLGIEPDGYTFLFLQELMAPGDPLHFPIGIPGIWPATPFVLPPGTLALGGQTWDAVAVVFGPGLSYLGRSGVQRLVW